MTSPNNGATDKIFNRSPNAAFFSADIGTASVVMYSFTGRSARRVAAFADVVAVSLLPGGPGPGGGQMIPDQGSLKETAPAKVLISLYEQSQTGILYFRQNEILKVFYLNRGKISWAISSDEADKIEHILLAKKMASPELLSPYQAGNKIAETFGKLLVENGVLSLEGLIAATREQVRQIASSVLRWSTGNYQLVQESPPTRLVSLDLEIPGLISGYVLAQMDVNIVWEELGSLSGELEQTTLPGKINLYPLDVEQQEAIDYLRTEVAVLRELHGPGRILLNDDQRRRLAVKGKVLGRKVLEEIGAGQTPRIQVYNKTDILGTQPRVDRDATGLPVRVWLSSQTGDGVSSLLEVIAEHLHVAFVQCTVELDAADARLRASFYAMGVVRNELSPASPPRARSARSRWSAHQRPQVSSERPNFWPVIFSSASAQSSNESQTNTG